MKSKRWEIQANYGKKNLANAEHILLMQGAKPEGVRPDEKYISMRTRNLESDLKKIKRKLKK